METAACHGDGNWSFAATLIALIVAVTVARCFRLWLESGRGR